MTLGVAVMGKGAHKTYISLSKLKIYTFTCGLFAASSPEQLKFACYISPYHTVTACSFIRYNK